MPNSNPGEFFDWVTHGVAHQPDLTVPAFVDHHFELGGIRAPFVIQQFDMSFGSPPPHDANPFSEPLHRLFLDLALDDHVVLFFDTEFRVSQSICQVPVVCTDQEPFGVHIEPSNRAKHNAHIRKIIDDCRPLSGVAECGHDALWLVDQVVQKALRLNRKSVYLDDIGFGVKLVALRGDELVIDLNSAL